MSSDLERLSKELKERGEITRSWQNFLRLLREKGRKILKDETVPDEELLYRGWNFLIKEGISPSQESLRNSISGLRSSVEESKRAILIMLSLLIGLQLLTVILVLRKGDSYQALLNCKVQVDELGRKSRVYELPDGTLCFVDGEWRNCQSVAIPMRD